MIRTAIVEDEPDAAETLSVYLERYQKTSDKTFHVTRFQNAIAFLEPYQGFDLVFMDILLPHMDGMEGALRLRKIDSRVKLIFVTSMAQYAVRGYEADALDFIVKPVAYSDFAFKMKRVMRALEMSREKELVISQASGLVRVSSGELLFVEVQGHKLIYHLADGSVESRGTMENAEEQLAPFGFLRCNNCYLVNLRYIDWVRGYTVKVGEHELQISHPRRKRFLEQIGEWYSKGGA